MVDMHLEVDIIPVSDVDRSKQFYQRLGWRLDSDAGTALGTVHTRRSTRGQRPWASARADSGPHCAAASVGACCLSGRVACVQARGFLILTRISHETSPTEG